MTEPVRRLEDQIDERDDYLFVEDRVIRKGKPGALHSKVLSNFATQVSVSHNECPSDEAPGLFVFASPVSAVYPDEKGERREEIHDAVGWKVDLPTLRTQKSKELEAIPYFIMETCVSTHAKDLQKLPPRLKNAGVGHYWVILPVEGWLLHFDFEAKEPFTPAIYTKASGSCVIAPFAFAFNCEELLSVIDHPLIEALRQSAETL